MVYHDPQRRDDMIRNIRDIAISKQFLISIMVIALMFTAFGFNIENSYAADVNDTVDDLGVEIDVEDKLENSQDNELLGTTYTVNGGKYSDIQKAIDKAKAGDTIKLSGTFVATSANDRINVPIKLTITSASTATLNGKNLCPAFFMKSKSAGSTLSNLKFINGYSSTEGGAVRVSVKSITINNCVFENNKAKLSSGALHTSYNEGAADNLVVKNCKFTKNSATNAAGALGAFGYNFKIDNCQFDSNWVQNSKNCYGGAIQVGLDTGKSYGVVSNCNFVNNKAVSTSGTSHGGAGCFRNNTYYKNCIFRGNSADHGGAITFHASGSLDNCQFYNNKANDYGGALSIALEQKTMVLTVSNCKFEGNTAPLGGAAKLDGMNIKILNSDFNSNSATRYGGAVNIDAKDVTISSSNFNDNVAYINGGAVYIKGTNTAISESNFNGNDAIPTVTKLDDGLGGAVYVSSSQATIQNNHFKYNTARNGSAIYFDKSGSQLKLTNNELYQNQAWVYLLPVYAHDIYYGEEEEIKSVIYGGNNIAKYDNLAVSNAIYNAAKNSNIQIDGETPVLGATMSGELYQDSREYNMDVLMTVTHEDGTVVYNETLSSSYLGEVSDVLKNLKPGVYSVKSTHFEDTYYKGITNITSFRVIPLIDNMILKSSPNEEEFNYEDLVIWTLNITNNGPNNATEVLVRDVLPVGLVYINDTSGGNYNPETGVLTIGDLAVGQSIVIHILTIVNKTGEINNKANVTSNEYDTNMTNNEDNASIVVQPAIDLEVVKSVNNSYPNYTEEIVWSIKVKNNGPDTAHDVNVVDVLPNTLIYMDCDGNYDKITGKWEIGTLESGDEITLHIRCKINATGLIENNATVSGYERDYDLTNNFDSEIVIVDPSSDLAIIKSANASSANFGDLVKWTLTVTNNGPDNATGVYIVDLLPEGFIYMNSTLQRGEYEDGKITIGDVAVGETLTFEIITRVNNTGNFTNVANVTGREFDYNLSNNEDNESIFIYPACDLEVIKEVNETEPKYGQNIVWSIIVKNNGPDTAHDIKVIDILPDSLVWIDDDSLGNYDHETGLWEINELESGDFIELNVICMVNATGNTTNYVNVTAREYDYNKTNNQDNETIEVESSADVAIEKSVNNTRPNYDELVIWTLTITNNGPDKATDIYIEENLPEGLVLVNYAASKGIFDEGRWVMCCLNKGEVQTLNLTCRVNKTGNITNIVIITAKEHDPNPENNEDNETINIPPSVDLELIKEVNNTYPDFGETIMWTITVTNYGPDNATGVVVEDILPTDIILLECNAGRGNYSDNKWTIGSLDVGCSEQLNITCIVNAIGEITNYAEVTSNEYDWNEINNYDASYVEVAAVVDLAIEKLVNNSRPNYGDLIEWTLIVTNNGPNDATGVIVNDVLPEGLAFVKASSDGYYDGVWDIGYLDAGESIELVITCKVSKTGNIANSANVSGDENDPDLSNNYDEKTIEVPPASDLSITKVAAKYYYSIGDFIEYAINVMNRGPDKANNVKVKEVFDNSLSLRSFKASAGDFNKLTKTWDIDSLDIGESASLLIKAVATKEGISNNTVKASSDNYDPDLTNNEDSAVVNVTKKQTEIPKLSKKAKIDKNIVENTRIDEIVDKILEKNVSGNSIFILLISLLVSMIFLGNGISNKR